VACTLCTCTKPEYATECDIALAAVLRTWSCCSLQKNSDQICNAVLTKHRLLRNNSLFFLMSQSASKTPTAQLNQQFVTFPHCRKEHVSAFFPLGQTRTTLPSTGSTPSVRTVTQAKAHSKFKCSRSYHSQCCRSQRCRVCIRKRRQRLRRWDASHHHADVRGQPSLGDHAVTWNVAAHTKVSSATATMPHVPYVFFSAYLCTQSSSCVDSSHIKPPVGNCTAFKDNLNHPPSCFLQSVPPTTGHPIHFSHRFIS